MLTLDVMLDMEMLMKFAPASVATAFASIVLPVPGGPNNSMPLQGWKQKIYSEIVPLDIHNKTCTIPYAYTSAMLHKYVLQI